MGLAIGNDTNPLVEQRGSWYDLNNVLTAQFSQLPITRTTPSVTPLGHGWTETHPVIHAERTLPQKS